MLLTRETSHKTTQRSLSDDHVRLHRLFNDVLDCLQEDDLGESRRVWTLFDAALNAHLNAEEECIFPAFRDQDAAETSALAADHVTFRLKLTELGMAQDLHTLRYDAARDFIEALEVHARREDALLYPWVEAHLSSDARALLLTRLHP